MGCSLHLCVKQSSHESVAQHCLQAGHSGKNVSKYVGSLLDRSSFPVEKLKTQHVKLVRLFKLSMVAPISSPRV